MADNDGIASKDLAEIKQDLIAYNGHIRKVQAVNGLTKISHAELALQQSAGLMVSMFEFLRTLEQRIERLENEKVE